MSDKCADGTERQDCDRCGETKDGIELIPVEIRLTSETWDPCDPCVDELVRWIDTDIKQDGDSE